MPKSDWYVLYIWASCES